MKADVIYFSATGSAKAIAYTVSEGLECETAFYDITSPRERAAFQGDDGDLLVIALPVYSERFPRFLMETLNRIDGNGRPMAGISVYGNIGYGVTMEQYRAFADRCGLKLIAAAAVIGRHTYANESSPVGSGRPDAADLEEARNFGRSVRKKAESGDFTTATIPKAAVPLWITKLPEGGVRRLVRRPDADPQICSRCDLCAARCPAGAIDPETLRIEETKCLRCGACVQVCPAGARRMYFKAGAYEKIFRTAGKKRRENRFFL